MPGVRLAPAPLVRAEGGPPLPPGEAVFVRSRAGDRLRAALFALPGAARGSVVLSPGRTEPLEKYGEVIGELTTRGFVVLVHDWVGQGLSDRLHRDPLRGHVRGGASRFLDGLRDILAAHEARLPHPWIAVGHSMGGGLTALMLAGGEARFDAAVLCAPMLGVNLGERSPGEVRTAARLMALLGRGAALPQPQTDPLNDRFEANVLTHDRARWERTQALLAARPELRLGGPTWDWVRFALDLSRRLAARGAAEVIAIPVAVVAASEERLVDNAALAAFVRRLPRGSLARAEGASHEILMETDPVRAVFWRAFDRVADEVAPSG